MSAVTVYRGPDELIASVGTELGPTDWLAMEQARIDGFADITFDHQWIHVDTARAAQSPYGTTVAHGFLTLALVPTFLHRLRRIENVRHGVNYGLDRVRFPAPVPSGARLRARSELREATPVSDETIQLITRTTIEVEGSPRPACVADLVSRYTFGDAPPGT